MSGTNKAKGQAGGASSVAVVVVVALLAGLVAAIVLLLQRVGTSVEAHEATRRDSTARRDANRQLGLPLEYPADILPIWEGADIVSQEQVDAMSTDGHPMVQWKIHAETDEDKKVVNEFYKERLLGMGMSQTMFAGTPSGYGVTYADELSEIQLVIEKKSTDTRTQLQIIFSRLKDLPAGS